MHSLIYYPPTNLTTRILFINKCNHVNSLLKILQWLPIILRIKSNPPYHGLKGSVWSGFCLPLQVNLMPLVLFFFFSFFPSSHYSLAYSYTGLFQLFKHSMLFPIPRKVFWKAFEKSVSSAHMFFWLFLWHDRLLLISQVLDKMSYSSERHSLTT